MNDVSSKLIVVKTDPPKNASFKNTKSDEELPRQNVFTTRKKISSRPKNGRREDNSEVRSSGPRSFTPKSTHAKFLTSPFFKENKGQSFRTFPVVSQQVLPTSSTLQSQKGIRSIRSQSTKNGVSPRHIMPAPKKRHKSFPKKQSIGIACCRYNSETSKPEILLVQKRYSYNFQAFVFGHYYPNNNKSIRQLLDGMTLPEKIDILSGCYDLLWYKIFLKPPKICYTDFCTKDNKLDLSLIKLRHSKHKKIYMHPHNKLKIKAWKNDYRKKSSKFDLPDGTDYDIESCYYCMQKYKYDKLFENGKNRLLLLMNQSKSLPLVWEIPKGRKHRDESEINCAIREFEEETFINPEGYKIVTTKPVSVNHISNNICYVSKYYIAAYNNDYIGKNTFGDNITTLTEIIDIKWVSLEDIVLLSGSYSSNNQHRRLYKLCSRLLRLFKNRRKNCKSFEVYKQIILSPTTSIHSVLSPPHKELFDEVFELSEF